MFSNKIVGTITGMLRSFALLLANCYSVMSLQKEIRTWLLQMIFCFKSYFWILAVSLIQNLLSYKFHREKIIWWQALFGDGGWKYVGGCRHEKSSKLSTDTGQFRKLRVLYFRNYAWLVIFEVMFGRLDLPYNEVEDGWWLSSNAMTIWFSWMFILKN